MNSKYNTKSFIEISNKIHNNKYDYSKTIYTTYTNKVIITCLVHGDFTAIAVSHMTGADCYECGRIKCLKNKMANISVKFFERAKELYGNKYSYSKFVSMNDKMEIICPKHGKILMTPISHIRNGSSGCKLCGVDVRSKKKAITKEEFLIRSNKKHNNFYNYDKIDYKNLGSKICITCSVHGDFLQRAFTHIKGKGCRLCGILRRAKLKTLDLKEFIQRSKEIHGDKYDYSTVIYVHGRKKVDIKCSYHGIFKQTPEGHLSGRGCKKCIHTTSECEIKWLNSIGLPNDDKHRSVIVYVGKKKFILDGYDPANKICYEYNGDWWHGNPAKYDPKDYNNIAHATFGELYKKTLEKKALLESAGYKVISIWESDYKNGNKTD